MAGETGQPQAAADDPMPMFPRRVDADGEFCDDPSCGECDDDWDGDDLLGDVHRPLIPATHPSQFSVHGLGRERAAMMHPAARTEIVRVGVLPRVFAAFLSLVVWWVVVLAGFFLAMFLYDSPSMILFIGLMLVPMIGETALSAELGLTPGKFLLGLRVRADDARPGWARSIVRTFVMIAPFLPMLIGGTIGDIAFIVGSIWLVVLLVSIAVDPEMRGLHDRIAGTSVVFRTPTCR